MNGADCVISAGNYKGSEACAFCGMPSSKFVSAKVGEDKRTLHMCEPHFNGLRKTLMECEVV